MSFYKSNLQDDGNEYVARAVETAAKAVRDVAELHRVRLTEAYAEIDRLEAENSDLREQLKALEREAADRDKLASESPKPQWTPPKSLKDGVYSVGGGTLRNAKITMTYAWARDAFADFSVPSVEGRWRKTGDVAEYLGP